MRAAWYAGNLTDSHFRAAGRVALRALGLRPDDDGLTAVVCGESLLAQRLVMEIVPEKLPALAEALDQQRRAGRPALTDRLPGMLALGWRYVHVLRSPHVPGDARPNLGLLGATFNAAVAVYDHLLDEPDKERPTPPGAAEALAGLVHEVLRDPATSHRPAMMFDDADWLLLMTLVDAWARTARAVVADGDPAAWPELAKTLASLLATETAVAAGHPRPADAAKLRHWISSGPARALGLMAALDPPPGDAVDHRAAAHLGEVMCLVDDIADLATDATRGQPNTLLSGVFGELADCDLYGLIAAGAAELAARLARPSPAEVNRFAHELAFRWLQWDQHPRLKTENGGFKQRDLVEVAVGATQMLLERQSTGYAGDEDLLTFPRDTVDGVRVETHGGLTFLRATVLDALLEAAKAGMPVPDTVLAVEGLELLKAKHPATRAGWSYLPDVTELPPDADDLAQVLRALDGLEGRSLASTCAEGVRLALDAAGPSTAVPTWILPREVNSALYRRMRRCVELVGGGGSHPDVAANLLLALVQSDPIRYREPIARGARWLAAQQVAEGWWPSPWYAGHHHGIALAVSVLHLVGGHVTQLRRAHEFLRDGQLSTGGWLSEGGEALPTAQALLSLSCLSHPEDASARWNAVRRLRELQQPDGGWPAEPWVCFPTREGPHTYGSQTATTAWALKALLAANRAEVRHGAEVR